jgi:hypothetical protein
MSNIAKEQTQAQPVRYALGQRFLYYPPGSKLTLDLSPEALQVLNQVLNMTPDQPADIFRKALAMYKAALEAHQAGKAVGAAATPDALETEFVGF